ncbi:Aspartyl protease family protein 1-like protein [Drosera capensis]
MLSPLLLLSFSTFTHFAFAFGGGGRVFSFDMHHRYSDQVKFTTTRLGKAVGGGGGGDGGGREGWPEKGTFEYYAALADHDRFFRSRSRNIAGDQGHGEGPLTFSDGNATFRISSLGFLHYVTVTLGTPGVRFLVALDTGSDLFWVPCDCASCAPIRGTTYGARVEMKPLIVEHVSGQTRKPHGLKNAELLGAPIGQFDSFSAFDIGMNHMYVWTLRGTSNFLHEATKIVPMLPFDFELSIYDPKESSTSKKVFCDNSLCVYRNRCSGTFSHCPYEISYVSAETSTSGILVEDVLHLATEDHHPEFVKAYITFGCGHVQTGSFLDVAAPNGLFGLGMDKISVPSILSREGFIADSFSMCFGHDGVGRISFGDKGNSDQQVTPFNVNPSSPTYNISVTQIQVGTAIVDLEFTALFDSGTSFTYLVDPAYSKLSGKFHSQIQDRRHPRDSRIPFEYCYEMSDKNTRPIPSVSLTMGGGSRFIVNDPIIVISNQNELIYCLAVVSSTELNIIGQNFMTRYRIVFDRENLFLGWQESDCYYIKVHGSSLEAQNATSQTPAVAVPPSKSAPPHPLEVTRNTAHNSLASRSTHIHYCSIASLSFALFLTL